jgi:hypothetical protein
MARAPRMLHRRRGAADARNMCAEGEPGLLAFH